jgi:3-dehydroquinate dehydratase II
MIKQIYIINGPNLNLTGRRQVEIYGNQSFGDYVKTLSKKYARQSLIQYFQSNSEGAIIDKLHEVGFSADGIILNAGGYSHTSIAIADAVCAINAEVIEVHLSNIFAREEFRHHSYISKHAKSVMCGFGLKGYEMAIESFLTK